MSEQVMIISGQPSDEDVVRLTAQGLNQTVTEKFASDALNVVDSCTGFQVAVDQSQNTLGYVGYTLYPLEAGTTLYVNTIMIDASRQGLRISSPLLTRAVRRESDVAYVGFKTQSARMYSAALRIFNNIYPRFDDEVVPEDIAAVGNALAEERGGAFPVHKGLYGGKPLYGTRPDANTVSDFYEMIDFEAGDALLCVCKVGQLLVDKTIESRS